MAPSVDKYQLRNLSVVKQDIDVLEVVERAGVELKRSGSRYVGLCPFHADTQPSFFVFPDGRFHCFGCNRFGDAIDFIQELHGCDFKEALNILGIRPDGLNPRKREELRQLQRQRERIKAFSKWEAEAIDQLSTLCRASRKVVGSIQTTEDLEKYGPRYHDLATWENHLDVLLNSAEQDKLEVFRSDTYG